MSLILDLEFGLVTVVAFVTGVVSYWVYRDASDRGMAHAAHWGAAVGLLFLFGAMVGGLVAVAAYVAYRPDAERDPVDYRRELSEASSMARECADESRTLARDGATVGRKAGRAAASGATALADAAGETGRKAVEEGAETTPGGAAVDAVEEVWDGRDRDPAADDDTTDENDDAGDDTTNENDDAGEAADSDPGDRDDG